MAQLQGILGWEAYTRIAQITVPTLVIHGKSDALVPPGNGELIAGQIPGSRLVLLEHASHLFLTDQTQQRTKKYSNFFPCMLAKGRTSKLRSRVISWKKISDEATFLTGIPHHQNNSFDEFQRTRIPSRPIMKMRRSETVRAWGIVCSHHPHPKNK